MSALSTFTSPALTFEVLAVCAVTGARASRMTLPHGVVDTPVFMPVATQASMKAVDPDELAQMGCRIMLNNTYHLGHRPGSDVVAAGGGAHAFQQWPANLLTDSGGFQIISLAKKLRVKEAGVVFASPYNDEIMLMTPEHSMRIQHELGSDIVMQLDHVVHATVDKEHVVDKAMHRFSVSFICELQNHPLARPVHRGARAVRRATQPVPDRAGRHVPASASPVH